MGFLKFILILLLIYYGLKIIWKFFGPILAKYAAAKMGDYVSRKFNGQQTPDNQPEVGDAVIDENSRAPNKTSNKEGDYIDYEEIK